MPAVLRTRKATLSASTSARPTAAHVLAAVVQAHVVVGQRLDRLGGVHVVPDANRADGEIGAPDGTAAVAALEAEAGRLDLGGEAVPDRTGGVACEQDWPDLGQRRPSHWATSKTCTTRKPRSIAHDPWALGGVLFIDRASPGDDGREDGDTALTFADLVAERLPGAVARHFHGLRSLGEDQHHFRRLSRCGSAGRRARTGASPPLTPGPRWPGRWAKPRARSGALAEPPQRPLTPARGGRAIGVRLRALSHADRRPGRHGGPASLRTNGTRRRAASSPLPNGTPRLAGLRGSPSTFGSVRRRQRAGRNPPTKSQMTCMASISPFRRAEARAKTAA